MAELFIKTDPHRTNPVRQASIDASLIFQTPNNTVICATRAKGSTYSPDHSKYLVTPVGISTNDIIPVCLPNGYKFYAISHPDVPFTMIRWPFYKQILHGQTMPWLDNSVLNFPCRSHYDAKQTAQSPPNSILPFYRGVKTAHESKTQDDIDFEDFFQIDGIVVVPMIVYGIPCIVQGVLVNEFFSTTTSLYFDDAELPMILLGLEFREQMKSLGADFLEKPLSTPKLNLFSKHPLLRIETEKNGEGKVIRVLKVNMSNIYDHFDRTKYPGGGISVYFANNSIFNSARTINGQSSSRRAEILSVIEALRIVRDILFHRGYWPVIDVVEFLSCAGVLISTINEYITRWKANNWYSNLKKPVNNQDLWRPFVALREMVEEASDVKMRFTWIARHLNEEAHGLALQACAFAGKDPDQVLQALKSNHIQNQQNQNMSLLQELKTSDVQNQLNQKYNTIHHDKALKGYNTNAGNDNKAPEVSMFRVTPIDGRNAVQTMLSGADPSMAEEVEPRMVNVENGIVCQMGLPAGFELRVMACTSVAVL